MKYSTNFTKKLKPYAIREFVKKTLDADVVEMGKNKFGIISVLIDTGDIVPKTFYAFDYFIESHEIQKNSLKTLNNKWQTFMTSIFGKKYEQELQNSTITQSPEM